MDDYRALMGHGSVYDELGQVAATLGADGHPAGARIDAVRDRIEAIAADHRGAVDTITHVIVMLGGLAEPWNALDYAERCARAENELRGLLDTLGGR